MNNLLSIVLMANPNGGKGDMISTLLPLLLIIVVFYFFMIRPQMKKQKEARKFRDSLKRGDEVLTIGGVFGKITEVSDTYVQLEIANGVVIKVDKSALVQTGTPITPTK
ncbi:MAG: preprotein translocase subunit YajC [Endomicrobiia bacterium]